MLVKDRLQPGRTALMLAWIATRIGFVNEQKYREKGWDSYAEKIQFKMLRLRLGRRARERADELQWMAERLRSLRVLDRCCRRQGPDRAGGLADEVTFKHSGNAGDLIYALPAMHTLCHGRPAKIFLKLGVPINGWSASQHPFGRSGLTAGAAEKLSRLLEHQPWVSAVRIHKAETVDFDLDEFREVPSFRLQSGGIPRWYFWLFGVHADLSRPWLQIRPPPPPRGRIVLARSTRYRNPNLDYAFLRESEEIDFVGTPGEYEEMRRVIPRLKYVECPDFLELARVIKSASFFVGNQSFPYALAEALKVPRILEVYPERANVVPCGGEAAEAFFQPHFEGLVRWFRGQYPPGQPPAGV